MTPSDYRKNTRREATLPSGLVVSIRGLSVEDSLSLGTIPDIFHGAAGDEEKTAKAAKERPDLIEKYARIGLCNCTLLVWEKEGKRVFGSIKDKEPGELGENDLAYREIAPEDVKGILSIVVELSGMARTGKGAAKEAVAPFPTQQAVASPT